MAVRNAYIWVASGFYDTVLVGGVEKILHMGTSLATRTFAMASDSRYEEFCGLTFPYIVAMAELVEGPWIMGNIVGVDPDKAGMELIGKKVVVGHKVLPQMNYTSGEGVSPTFKILS